MMLESLPESMKSGNGKGEGARPIAEYKFFWKSCERGIQGVGAMVAHSRWIEKALDIKELIKRE